MMMIMMMMKEEEKEEENVLSRTICLKYLVSLIKNTQSLN